MSEISDNVLFLLCNKRNLYVCVLPTIVNKLILSANHEEREISLLPLFFLNCFIYDFKKCK